MHANQNRYVHGGNTKIPTCAVDLAGSALNGCRPRNTAFDRAVRLSTGGIRFVGALLESNLKVFFNNFLSEFVVRHFTFLGTALVNYFISCFHVAMRQTEKREK